MLGYHVSSHQMFSPPESLRCGGQCGLPNEESEEREQKGTESCHAGALSSDVTKTHFNVKPVMYQSQTLDNEYCLEYMQY